MMTSWCPALNSPSGQRASGASPLRNDERANAQVHNSTHPVRVRQPAGSSCCFPNAGPLTGSQEQPLADQLQVTSAAGITPAGGWPAQRPPPESRQYARHSRRRLQPFWREPILASEANVTSATTNSPTGTSG